MNLLPYFLRSSEQPSFFQKFEPSTSLGKKEGGENMKKWFVTAIFSLILFLGGFSTYASATNQSLSSSIQYILKQNPGLNKNELMNDVREIAQKENQSYHEVIQTIVEELKEEERLTVQENTYQLMGADTGTKVIGPATRGYIFYTPASTWGLDHGHVGMYYTSTSIVESVPGDGVRHISAYTRRVENTGAVLKRVNTSSTNINAAVDWAVSRIGVDGYSYNFATNRETSHYGDKNCSKLIWSAFMLKAGIDIDVDKGLGVYPRDIRDSGYMIHVRNL